LNISTLEIKEFEVFKETISMTATPSLC